VFFAGACVAAAAAPAFRLPSAVESFFGILRTERWVDDEWILFTERQRAKT
jgi:hypothetical protein